MVKNGVIWFLHEPFKLSNNINNKNNNLMKNNLIIFILAFPDPLDLATGMEKREMLSRLAGNEVSICINVILFYNLHILYFRIHTT